MYRRIGNYDIGFYYINTKTNQKISDESTIEWIKSLKIAPAYHDVHIYPDKNNKILAFGYDSKNRKQYIYNPNFVQQQSYKKFDRVISNHRLFDRLSKTIMTNIRNANEKTKQIAIVLYLIIHCGFRIGNKNYDKNNKSYGISTIKFRHVHIYKNCIVIDFIGKKGVRNISQCANKHIVDYLTQEKNVHNDDDDVFSITSKDVNTYLKKFHKGITSKDLRTWNANLLFIKMVSQNVKRCVKNPIKKAIEVVAHKLHNTMAVCKKNYIDPNIIKYMEDKIKNDDIK